MDFLPKKKEKVTAEPREDERPSHRETGSRKRVELTGKSNLLPFSAASICWRRSQPLCDEPEAGAAYRTRNNKIMGSCASKEDVKQEIKQTQETLERTLKTSIQTLLEEHAKEMSELGKLNKAVDTQKEHIDAQKRQIDTLKQQNEEMSTQFDEQSTVTELELEHERSEVEVLKRKLEKAEQQTAKKLDKASKEATKKLKEMQDELVAVQTERDQSVSDLEAKLSDAVRDGEQKLADATLEHSRDYQALDEKRDGFQKGMEQALQEKEEYEKKVKELTDLLDMFRKMYAPGSSTLAESTETDLALVALADPAIDGGPVVKQTASIGPKSLHRVAANPVSDHGLHARSLFAVKDKTERRLNWALDDELPLNRWDGIRCNEEEEVTHINLSEVNLRVDLVELGHIFGPQMETVKLDKNADLGGNLAHLLGSNLDASNTWLQEQKLQTVDLHYTQVSGSIVVFRNCPFLQRVALGYTKVHGDIEVFRNCPNLVQLRMYMCRGITGDIEVCRQTPQLEWLDLTGTTVEGDITVFSKTPKLQWLWLDDTNVKGDISVFVTTPNLVELWLGGTKVVGDKKQFERSLPKCSIVMETKPSKTSSGSPGGYS